MSSGKNYVIKTIDKKYYYSPPERAQKLRIMKKIYDRAGFEYVLAKADAVDGCWNYVTFTEDGKPLVVRNGQEVRSSFFTDGKGRWAKLINSTDAEKVAKALKKSENPVIVMQDGEIVCQMVPMTGILWHDNQGRKFYLASKYEREELEADGLGYISAESDGTYKNLRYIAFDGVKEIEIPKTLYNEKNRRFVVGVNFKALAYDKMAKTGSAAIAIKNALKPVYARKADTGEFLMAHTNGAYEAAEFASDDIWQVEYCSGGGSWGVRNEEFFARYEFLSVDADGRAVFIAKAARYVWVHLFGDFIGCIPQWGDAMVAMSNPQVNITNPDDVYACSYIEFYGTEDIEGAYIVVDELYLGAPEHVILEFAEAMAGFVESSYGVPKSVIDASNLTQFIREKLAVPPTAGIQEKVMQSVA